MDSASSFGTSFLIEVFDLRFEKFPHQYPRPRVQALNLRVALVMQVLTQVVRESIHFISLKMRLV